MFLVRGLRSVFRKSKAHAENRISQGEEKIKAIDTETSVAKEEEKGPEHDSAGEEGGVIPDVNTEGPHAAPSDDLHSAATEGDTGLHTSTSTVQALSAEGANASSVGAGQKLTKVQVCVLPLS